MHLRVAYPTIPRAASGRFFVASVVDREQEMHGGGRRGYPALQYSAAAILLVYPGIPALSQKNLVLRNNKILSAA